MIWLILFVIVYLAAALLATLGRKVKYAGDIIMLAATAAMALLSLYAWKLSASGAVLEHRIGGWPAPLGISLVVDGLSAFMLVLVNVISFFIALFAISYIKRYTDRWKFKALFLLLLTGLNGVILSGDIFNMYIFLEIASIAGYVLVSFSVEPESLEAAFKYTIMGALASICILLAIALLYSYSSTLLMSDMAAVLAQKPQGAIISFISVLLLAGFGLKSAIVPFHAWLPDAHSSAPSPISAVLSGLVIKTTGLYAMMRIFFNVLGYSAGSTMAQVIMVLGIVSMLAGAFLAIMQFDIKRMFAYSTISQVGYIVLAIGIGTPLALLGCFLYIATHAVGKTLLFLNAGAIEHATGTRNMYKLGGLQDKLPIARFTSLIGALSISGIPPFGGFWAKALIVLAAVQAGYIGYALVAVLVSVVTLGYYLKFQTLTFSPQGQESALVIKELSGRMKSALVSLAVVCALAGVLLLPAYRPFLQEAVNVLLKPAIPAVAWER